MTRRSKVWLAVAVLFIVINLAGAVFAATRREALHASTHVGLLLLGVSLVWWLVPSRHARRNQRWGEAVVADPPSELSGRLTRIEQAIDAVAIEVERIGEGQRFITRVFTENGSTRAPGEGVAEPTDIQSRESAPRVQRE